MRYAVVFKTYQWDQFVHRQASRCQTATGPGDFFISIDETNGSVGPVPFDRVIRTCNADMVKLGFPERFEAGSLLWWNADYAHYQFQALHPDYDYYVFVEYDAIMQGDFETMLQKVEALKSDYVAQRLSTEGYFWTLPHRQVYQPEDIRAALMCISVFSPRGLAMLADWRRAMAADPNVTYWPMAEIYLATEIERQGYNFNCLSEFGDTSRYVWFPPMLEDDVKPSAGTAFVHPVLDKDRCIRSIIRNNTNFRGFIYWKSTLYRRLSRFPRQDYIRLLPAAARKRLRTSLTEKSQRIWLYISTSGIAKSLRGS
jgi:hypothetical protein